ncbi:DUF207 domain-containing protein [Coniochaeta ligniaria NRRL 30616]|uniref:tRNA(Phe) 7-[(3-amino-3-carboxypropyl)-4-demethylwyosine(37)-N(4)]-methyltransferase n=1 Tax=Coniochaeta ligniaria NRRL 30616 TaxID=1408157 RepID=A0A1J7IUR0_9PEZI|nr:DUF207 domain-containing protein [Coniochaeta ligniaria NRRL 30616]
MKPLPKPHAAFEAKKAKILSQLSIPDADYTDASPKGSVDEGIRDLIGEINAREGLVTTSSCAGRVSVFVEGSKSSNSSAAADDNDVEGERPKPASAVGGKGGGGAWLFVSHDPVGEGVLQGEGGVAALFGLEGRDDGDGVGGSVGEPVGGSEASRLIHFKFEPMILHILTASPQHAQLVLKCGLQAGFRESGAVSLLEGSPKAGVGEPATPMVAVRSMGLSFESLVGTMDGSGRKRSIVSPEYLKMLVLIANERFVENRKRIARFLEGLRAEVADAGEMGLVSRADEKELRRETKRAEGLRRQAEARSRPLEEAVAEIESYIDDLAQDTNLS